MGTAALAGHLKTSINKLHEDKLSLQEIAYQSDLCISKLEEKLSDANEGYENMIEFMKEEQQELEGKLTAVNQKFENEVAKTIALVTEKAILEKKLRGANKDNEIVVKFMIERKQELERKLTAANQKIETVVAETIASMTAKVAMLEKSLANSQNEKMEMKMEKMEIIHWQHKQIQSLEVSLSIENINVNTGKEDMARMRGELVMLEMQAAEAGNGKLVEFLLEVIERKERFLECPVCMEVAAPPILCCPEQHLICSSCQPDLRECPECRIRYQSSALT